MKTTTMAEQDRVKNSEFDLNMLNSGREIG